MKKCCKCKIDKPLSEFHKRNDRKSGVRSKCIQCELIYRNSHQRQVPQKLIEYRGGAKRRGLEFNLTEKEFESFWQVPCSYCGNEIETIGLDRIDSSRGYFLDNVTSCCAICNTMKLAMSRDIFLEQCQKVTNHQI